ncbi:SBBP repeat-containing protein [Nannocystis radixulma]|uniref:SBBP repeat-containing protein n=1 Tax=Nannocystis radixulma TaxID=2995305 RepID=A0ABT5AXR1_9BACT|nr:SBBP repeat-containing protein [Nannocystis radixulma]MDC0666250.1 SBBP repeat-containing protein [Nannocystis radixulma]
MTVVLGGVMIALGGPAPEAHAVSRQWGTYHGGSASDEVRDVGFTSYDVDVVGWTESTTGIATVGSPDTSHAGGTRDAYVARFDAWGDLTWARYFGGQSGDWFEALAHDDLGALFAVGTTSSTSSISTVGTHQFSIAGGQDAMLEKFDSSGSRVWGTYFGGSDTEQGYGICIDEAGDIYIVGSTESTGIATSGAHDETLNSNQDAFLAKFDPDGDLVWATYFGGSDGNTSSRDCAIDGDGNVYIIGSTEASVGIANVGWDNSFAGDQDGFLAKFDPDGDILWATYFGGAEGESVQSVAIDSDGNAYICGWTESAGLATDGAHDEIIDDADAFVAKFDDEGLLDWATYFGGDNGQPWLSFDDFTDIKEFGGMLYLAGRTDTSSGIATAGAWDSTHSTSDQTDMFVMMTTDGVVSFGSYNGGANSSQIAVPTVAVSSLGRAVTGGGTISTSGVATSGTHDTSFNGTVDAFLTYIHLWDV